MEINDAALKKPDFDPEKHPDFTVKQDMIIIEQGTDEEFPGMYFVVCKHGMLPVRIDRDGIQSGTRIIRRSEKVQFVAQETSLIDTYFIVLNQAMLEALAQAVGLTVDKILASQVPAKKSW